MLACILLLLVGQPCGCHHSKPTHRLPVVRNAKIVIVHDTVWKTDTVVIADRGCEEESGILRIALNDQRDRATTAWNIAALFAQRCDTLRLEDRSLTVVIHDERRLLMPYVAGGVRAQPHSDPDWLFGAGAQFVYGHIGFECLASIEMIPAIITKDGLSQLTGGKQVGTIVQGILKLYIY